MTILDYNQIDTDLDKLVSIPFIGRSGSISSIVLINKDTKEEYTPTYTESADGVTVDFSSFWADLTIDTILSIIVKGVSNNLYRDIVVFNGRIDTKLDYTQNEQSGTGYVFG